MPTIAAIGWVMRTDGCDRAEAMRQIETAVRDGALRFIRRDGVRFNWNAEVYRPDMIKLWPRTTTGETEAELELISAAGIRVAASSAADWHALPIPKRTELVGLREELARLKTVVEDVVRSRDSDSFPPIEVGERCRAASVNVDGELIECLARGRMAAILETVYGLERLPYGPYWATSDGGATSLARRVLLGGVASSHRHPSTGGIVLVHAREFALFQRNYLHFRGLLQQKNAPKAAEIRPNWQTWQYVPEVTLREAIALSLDLDPRCPFSETPEFRERMFVAQRNLEILQVTNSVAAHYLGDKPLIRLQRFAGWTISIGWKVPPELAALTVDALREPISTHKDPPSPKAPLPAASPQDASISGRIGTKTKRSGVAAWIAITYREGLPVGLQSKAIAQQFEKATGIRVDVRTVRRALGKS